MSELFGIDVSRNQKDIDWSKVKKDFAIVKITNKGNVVEDKFEQNYKGCVDNNIPIGGYKYVYAKTVEEAKAEAEGMLRVLNGRKLPYGIWIDMEDKTIRPIGKQALSAVILEEAEILKAAGYFVGVYCNYDWYKNVLDSKMLESHYPFWIARYKMPDLGAYDENWKNNPKSYAFAWQYSSKGKVAGINGNVDLDVFYGAPSMDNKEDKTMTVLIASARHDENGKLSGGKLGDQLQKIVGGFDKSGEVSVQSYYKHSKVWRGLRPIDPELARKLVIAMVTACNNKNIGYTQAGGAMNRYGVYNYGVNACVPVGTDCSELIRAVLKECGRIVPDFNTSNEAAVLLASGWFKEFTVNSAADLFEGDILVTKTKGHTVMCVQGNKRVENADSCSYSKPSVCVTSPANAKAQKFKGKYVSKGKEVGYVQWHLDKWGADLGKSGVDEDCGSKTVSAIKAYQTAHGLKSDGIAGPKTYAVMDAQ